MIKRRGEPATVEEEREALREQRLALEDLKLELAERVAAVRERELSDRMAELVAAVEQRVEERLRAWESDLERGQNALQGAVSTLEQRMRQRIAEVEARIASESDELNAIIDRFSGHKIISLTFGDRQERDFSALGEVVEQTPVSVQLKVPRAKVTEVCRQLLSACSVSDINVQELPVEDVIRQLCGERSAENRAPAEETP